MKKILFVFLTCLTLPNCLTFISGVALSKIDNQNNKGKNENCDIQTYVNYDGKHYTHEILPFIAIPEMFAGLYGFYYFYPNGLKMYASLIYSSVAFNLWFDSNQNSENEKPNSSDRFGNRLNVASAKWNQSKHSHCKNQLDFFSYKNRFSLEIDLTKKEYSQIQGNNFSNEETFQSICKNNQSSLEEDFYQRLFFLYEEEIKKVQSKRGYYDSDTERIEKEIAELNKKRFTKQQIQTILKKENLKYMAFLDSSSFEYPATVTCTMSFYLQYPGGEGAFKYKMETYFRK